jgi:hypothetical protein
MWQPDSFQFDPRRKIIVSCRAPFNIHETLIYFSIFSVLVQGEFTDCYRKTELKTNANYVITLIWQSRGYLKLWMAKIIHYYSFALHCFCSDGIGQKLVYLLMSLKTPLMSSGAGPFRLPYLFCFCVSGTDVISYTLKVEIKKSNDLCQIPMNRMH